MGATFLIVGCCSRKAVSAQRRWPRQEPRGAGVCAANHRSARTVMVLAMVLPVAVLFAAVLMAVSLFAKSMKERRAMCRLDHRHHLPAMMGMLPGVELNARLALVPILNLALVSKELVSGVFHCSISPSSSARPASTPPPPWHSACACSTGRMCCFGLSTPIATRSQYDPGSSLEVIAVIASGASDAPVAPVTDKIG